MKLTAIFIFLFVLQSMAETYAQVTLREKNAPLEKVLQDIKKQSGYDLVYKRELVRTKGKPVAIHLTNATLANALELIFKDQLLDYELVGKIITVKEKSGKIKLPISNNSTVIFQGEQELLNIDVKGRVVNEKGEPLSGVSIFLKGTKRGTTTNERGDFFLKIDQSDAILVITSIGYKEEEIKINNRVEFLITLRSEINILDEKVVIAYGSTTKRLNTGSVGKISSEEIEKQPISNPLEALQGRIPGLVVTSTGGLPGSSFTIQIRGQNSVNPNPSLNAGVAPLDNPLFIIDGVPFATQNNNINQLRSISSPGNNPIYGNQNGGLSPFNSLNPNDIESIEVLRDADATSIYGSRGSNGVILITTKKGKPGKTKFSLNLNSGQSTVTRTMPLMNTFDYLKMRREAYSNDGITPNSNPGTAGFAPDLTVYDSSINTDWKKYFLGGTSVLTNLNGMLSGGTENTNFSIGIGLTNQSYILPGDLVNRKTSFASSLNHSSIDKKFNVNLSLNYSLDKNSSGGNQFLLQSFILSPNFPNLYDDNGKIVWNYKGVQLVNPASYQLQKYDISNYNLNSSIQVSYELFKGLSLSSSFGYNTFYSKEISKTPLSSLDPTSNSMSSARFGINDYKTWLIEPQLNYKHNIGRGTLSILAGGTYQKNTNSQLVIEATNYSNDNLLGSISAAVNKNVTDAFLEKKYMAFFARGTFLWDRKYIINVTGRRDGSSRFGPGKQFGNFGSIGAAWIFSEENLLKNAVNFLSFGKFRASYGLTGNDNIQDYQFLSRWGIITPSYQNTIGYVPLNLFNNELHWSTTKKLEAALELGFFKDKLFVNLAWYRNQCADQLVTYVLPSQTGFRGITSNFPAVVENKGWEIELSSTLIDNKKLKWKSSINLSIPKNTLLSFPGIENSSYSNVYEVGQSLSLLKLYRSLGVNRSSGFYEFETKTGPSSSPTNSDRFLFGNLDPSYYGGLSNSLTYNRIQLDIFLEFRKQIGANYLQQINSFRPGLPYNQPTDVLDRWQKPGDESSIQKFSAQNSGLIQTAADNFMRSSGAYSDASFLRVKTISANYHFSERVLKKLKLSSLKLYANAQNLFVLTNYRGNDPETKSFYSLPPLKTFSLGFQITF